MKDLLEFILKHLTDHPDDVVIDLSEDDASITVSMTVNPEDVGRVIGKEGKTINAIRSLAKVIAIKEKKKLNINLVS